MEKTVEITLDVSLSKTEYELLMRNLNCDDADPDRLKNMLKKMAEASFNEYKRMFTGVSIPNTISEFRLERLYNLLMHYFNTAAPDEEIIGTLLHTSNSTSKQLIKNTHARHKFDLSEKLKQTVCSILEQNDNHSDSKSNYLEITDSCIVDFINLIITKEKPGLTKLHQGKDHKACIYICQEDTYKFLKERFK